MQTEHDTIVQRISAQVREFDKAKIPFRIYHGSTLSTRTSARRRSQIIDTSSLNNILSFDHEKKRVWVEPNVPMDHLVRATRAVKFLPKVVMELPNITAGGGFAGTSGESSSFKHGLFDRTIIGIEIVLGNGDVIKASGEDPETRDLFFGCAGSCGSLGVITALQMELIDAKEFVELEYVPVSSIQESIEVLQRAEKDASVDYIDGIQFALDRGVIMLGRLSANILPGTEPRTFNRATDAWFYMHAEQVLEKHLGDEVCFKESIPVDSYLFRYDRGVFWSGLRAFSYFATPFNSITRYLLDPFMYSRTMIHALHRSGLASQAIIQDLAVPYEKAEDFIRWTDERTGLWPLWLCPVKPSPQGEKSFSMGKQIGPEMQLDIGIWGMGPKDPYQFIKLNRDFERKVEELGGLKCLYAHAYYTQDEFWRIYDEDAYNKLRNKYHAESLPSVYDKVKVDLKGIAGGVSPQKSETWTEWLKRSFWGTWPLGGLYGVASATKGLLVQSDFLLKK
ncbi:FAD-binding domain-containing protein [Aaosphaeria arxii CBS 175.79]|uniref:Delta(24)-sterol reductase n=1 Tax=Aaosphaeria arxii CBS 175.79 TaxID=1450172 RepID=A0A6A5Y5Q6_9PLEO|nr:FAD-binding domain-containing protein [Aaosphaeria arxii CBS 175.79]KAF2020357.1 FAD-binding domain-containing protein [Aaosphaeria arxii CBS 175.79]